MQSKRRDHEPPSAIAERGWRYHHLGIPTFTPRSGERYIPQLKMYVSGFETSPYGVEWMRFEPDCQVPDLIRMRPHLAFDVDNLDSAIVGKTLLCEISSPSEGVRVAMVLEDDMAIELLEFRKP